jgi:hypothetical protein
MQCTLSVGQGKTHHIIHVTHASVLVRTTFDNFNVAIILLSSAPTCLVLSHGAHEHRLDSIEHSRYRSVLCCHDGGDTQYSQL